MWPSTPAEKMKWMSALVCGHTAVTGPLCPAQPHNRGVGSVRQAVLGLSRGLTLRWGGVRRGTPGDGLMARWGGGRSWGRRCSAVPHRVA
jgi:hypothetical protein